ncbi:mitochondrial 54S ribosomal protein bL32m ASCRUDRAFT_23646, partial [Ascoidea rubescens DSM 1968]
KLEELIENLKNQDPNPIFNPLEMGILKAVPKQKVSHCRRRKRQLDSSKHLKLKLNLNCCPSCGRVKKDHFLCHHCAFEIRSFWKRLDKKNNPQIEEQRKFANQEFLSKTDQRILYPGRFDADEMRQLRNTDNYILKRDKPIFFERN